MPAASAATFVWVQELCICYVGAPSELWAYASVLSSRKPILRLTNAAPLLGTDEGAPRLARYREAPAAACVLLAMTVVVFTVPPGVRAGQQIVVQAPNGQRVTVQLRVVQLPPRSQRTRCCG